MKADDQFSRLLLAVLPELRAFALSLTHDGVWADDLVQEAFVRALRSFETLRGEDARPWLLAIVRNLFLTRVTSGRPYQVISLDALIPDPEMEGSAWDPCDPDQDDPETALMRRNDIEIMQKLVEALPSPFREVVVLREFEELSYKEIATVTGTPIGTVMSRLARARQILQQSCKRLESHREQNA